MVKIKVRNKAIEVLLEDLADPFNELDKIGNTFLNSIGIKKCKSLYAQKYNNLKKQKFKTIKLI